MIANTAHMDDLPAFQKSEGDLYTNMTTLPDVHLAVEPPSNATPERLGEADMPAFVDAPGRRMRGLIQLAALTEKNIIVKSRSPLSTLLELLTPVAFSSVLVLGYFMGTSLENTARHYTGLTFDVPGFYLKTAVGVFKGLLSKTTHNNRILEDAFEGPIGANHFFGGAQNDASDSAIQAKQFSDVMYNLLTHPLPIPTLSQFVALANSINSATSDLRSSKFYNLISQSDYGQSLYNLLQLGTLHLSPNGPVVDMFLSFLHDTHPSIFVEPQLMKTSMNTSSSLQIRVHDNAQEALLYITENANEPAWALIDMSKTFSSASSQTKGDLNELLLTRDDLNNATFIIRMNYTTIPNTSERATFFAPELNTNYQKYYLSGFLTLQQTLHDFAFSQASSVLSIEEPSMASNCLPQDPLQIWSMPFPTPQYNINTFFATSGYLVSLVLAMGFLYPVSRLVKSIVEEKELRLKETMFILGVKPWAYFLSWVVVAYCVFLLGAVFVTSMLHVTVIKFSSYGFLLALISLFCSATIGFCFFVSAFFAHSKLASIISPIALFATTVPYLLFFGSNRYENTAAKIFASLLPGTALSLGVDILAAYERVEIGVHNWNASEGDYSFNVCLVMMTFDTALYIFLGWYLQLILPSSYGVPRPFYFCLLPSYWGCTRIQNLESEEDEVAHDTDENSFEIVGPEFGLPTVIIKDLVKRYSRAGPNAVDNLSLNLYENQITCLLGHNGAGKTSLISLLTGLFPATSGDCIIYNRRISNELDKVRESIGICPQHDIHFPELTVAEHLRLFEKIKGAKASSESVRKRANDVGLTEKLNALSGQLSGGMKRKLSIAIAMCGEPKFILLDEPTTGMDPYSRRATWEMLRKSKKNRVILLTTHFMDEADILSDHLAVMKAGRLQCFGSPLFLKSSFGLGYTFTVILTDSPAASKDNETTGKAKASNTDTKPARTVEQSTSSLQASRDCQSARKSPSTEEAELENGLGSPLHTSLFTCSSKVEHRKEILFFLQEYITGAQMVRHSGREVVYRFPNGSERQFPSFFCAFDSEMRKKLGIAGYGISNSSLEEVFLQLAEHLPRTSAVQNHTSDESLSTEINARPGDNPPCPSREFNSNLPLNVVETETEENYLRFARQLYILLSKRFSVQRHDIMGFLFVVLMPVLAIGLVLLVLTLRLGQSGPLIPMSLELYKAIPFSTRGKSISVPIGHGSSNQTSGITFLELGNYLESGSSFAEVFYATPSVNSSNDMSKYLLKMCTSHNRATSLGSYVMDDRIKLSLSVYWDGLLRLVADSGVIDSSLWGRLIEYLSSTQKRTLLQESVSEQTKASALLWLQKNLMEISQLAEASSGNATSKEKIQNIPYPKGMDRFDIALNASISILHNTSSPHGVAVFNNEYTNARYKHCTGNGSLHIENHPLPISTNQSIEVRATLSIFTVLFLLIPLCFVPSAFVVFIVKEKSCKSKHVQLVSGVNLSSFWIAHYIWDMLMYSIFVALVMIVLALYGAHAEVFMGDAETAFATFFLLFSYGVSSIPFAYLCSRSFDNHSNAQIAVLCIFFITGFVMQVTYGILLTMAQRSANVLRPFFLIFPAFNIGDGLLQLSLSFYKNYILGQNASPFDWDVAGTAIFLLFALSIPYFGLFLILEYGDDGGSGGAMGRALRKLRRYTDHLLLKWSGARLNSDGELLLDEAINDEDDDVIAEKNRVLQNETVLQKTAKVLLVNLWKVYPASGFFLFRAIKSCLRCSRKNGNAEIGNASPLQKQAVRNLTLAIERGEIFGLLGVNGAGKTTTMAILTGDTFASSGKAFVAGYDVTGRTANGVAEARKRIGFCPQVDPLLDLMTGRETLRLFGSLRGIPWNQLDTAVDEMICALALSKYADKTSASYSGGYKRKLSLGVALIGSPEVILIDESSSGLDPFARRKIWDLIAKAAESRLVVLTTHSMEEAEALCTRVTIMVGGEMKCIGSVQHLKSKYLGGYTLDVQLDNRAIASIVESVKAHIMEVALPCAVLVEEHGFFLRFSIPSGTSDLGNIFSTMESMKNDGSMLVREYSVSQSTLEQVFINLAKEGAHGESGGAS